MNDATICISTFLRDESLFRCLESIRKVYPSIPVIVSDDGRKNRGKTARIKGFSADYIPLDFDVGLAAKRNIMIDKVSTPYVILMDDDMLLKEDSNLHHLRILMDVADVAAGSLFYPKKNRQRSYVARMIFHQRALHYLPLNTPWQFYDNIKYRKSDLTLNCFVAKREVLQRIRWDERFKITYEHSDFFVRLKLAGKNVVYCPSAVFYEERERNPEYRSYRLRVDEHKKLFFQKWLFSQMIKHPSIK